MLRIAEGNKLPGGAVSSEVNLDHSQKPLRLWLGIAAVMLWVIRFGLPSIVPEALLVGLAGGMLGALAVIVWWAFFSGAPRVERWGAVVLMIVALFATWRILLDKSIATGMQGAMFFLYAIPSLGIALALWAVFSRRLSDQARRASMVATILLACGGWAVLRIDGIT